jgi:hypothetical protein
MTFFVINVYIISSCNLFNVPNGDMRFEYSSPSMASCFTACSSTLGILMGMGTLGFDLTIFSISSISRSIFSTLNNIRRQSTAIPSKLRPCDNFSGSCKKKK